MSVLLSDRWKINWESCRGLWLA